MGSSSHHTLLHWPAAHNLQGKLEELMNTASSVVQGMCLLILNSSEPAAISEMNCEIN